MSAKFQNFQKPLGKGHRLKEVFSHKNVYRKIITDAEKHGPQKTLLLNLFFLL